ncbi:MAG: ABC transporter permease [Ruminococcus sp.]|nr:ABC transporter permease [Ruminococcus sp.]
MKKYKSYFLGGCMVVLVLLLWQLASDTGLFGKYDINRGRLMFPSPVFVLQRMIELIGNGYLLKHIWISFKRVITGFFFSVLLGLPIGILMGRNENINMFLQPLFKILAPIPGVAWVPLAILWFGLGDRAAIFIIIVSAITPIVINTIQGVESIDPNLESAMIMLRASKWQSMKFLIIPSVIPYIVTGFKLGLGYAWRVVIAAEMVGVPDGLGYVLNLGRSTAQTEITFITIIVLCVMLALIEKCLFGPLEKITGAWKKEK